jgi:hypothetical protein
MKARFAAALALLAVLTLPACSGGGGDDKYVLEVDGSASVTTSDGTRTFESGRHKVQLGDTIQVTDGSAVLALPGPGALELRAGRTVRALQANAPAPTTNDSRLRVTAVPELVAGDALVMAGGDDVRLVAGGATLRVDGGAARVRRSSGVTLAVYRGEADVNALGRSLPQPVEAFRQVAVADTGALPRRAVPLVYDRKNPDPWDVRYLGDALDLGDQLDRRALALNRQVTAPAADASLLSQLVPTLRSASGFDGSLVDSTRSVGESVVGASIALSGPGDFVRRWNAAFEFREDGADWGLVALDQRARRAALFGTLDGVLDRLPGRFATTVTTRGTTTTTSTTGGGSSTTTTTTPGTPPTTVPRPPEPLSDLLEPVLPPEEQSPGGLLGDVMNEVGGLLGAQSRARADVQPLGVSGS